MIILDSKKYYNLGSVSMTSDLNGTVSQYIEYIPFGEDMYSAHRNTYNSPYRYTAKELDEETGLYYYGARYYNPKLSVWLSVDPMVEKYISLSPNNYVMNNPIKYIDPDGRRYINYDENGNYTGTTKDNWWHNLWHGSKGRIMNDDGNVKQKFTFADPENDVKDIQIGVITKLVFVKENEIQKMMWRSGSFDEENRTKNKPIGNRYEYILQEGIGEGKLDFSYSQIPKLYNEASNDPLNKKKQSPMIFLVDGVAQNHINFGNFLFGAAGNLLGYSLLELSIGGHYNSLFNSETNGYLPQFDSKDDQIYISLGFKQASENKYGDRKAIIEVELLSKPTVISHEN